MHKVSCRWYTRFLDVAQEKDTTRLLRLLGQRDVEIDAMKELLAKKW